MATLEILTTADDRMQVDLLLFNRLRREIPGLVEDTLDRNQGIAALGPFLPRGTRVIVAIPSAVETSNPTPLISLYD